MADAPVGHRLGRWLPATVRRDLFEPALRDLYIRELPEPAARRTPRRPFARRLAFVIRDRRSLRCLLVVGAVSVLRPLACHPVVDAPHSPSQKEPSFMWTDLRHAVRLLFRERTFAAAAVLTLALGVGANVAVFAVVEAVLLRPLPYEAADDSSSSITATSAPASPRTSSRWAISCDMAARQSSLETSARLRRRAQHRLRHRRAGHRVNVAAVAARGCSMLFGCACCTAAPS